MDSPYDLIVFCHLRWNFVWQRPQQILSRLAPKHRVFYVEEPIFESGTSAYWRLTEPSPNIFVCTPVTDCPAGGFHASQTQAMQSLLNELCETHAVEKYVVWTYTPMALPAIEQLSPLAIVYDCMDELSAFLGAPPELLDLESKLLSVASLVFTGGPALYQAKRARHANVYCFPSSVDQKHFSKAKEKLSEPDDQSHLSHPRLGFFGVIDERFDVALLGSAAAEHPDWQFVIVGPVVKIDPAVLPQAPNIHYVGQKTYDQLPSYLSGWDVCLMPFAKNEATRFISPTKTLEYMAAEKPIVSTSITDVVVPYGDIVDIGDSPSEFVAACEATLSQNSEEREKRLRRMRDVLSATSWDQTVSRMETLVTDAVGFGLNVSFGGDSIRSFASLDDRDSTEVTPLAIIGAGPTGLSAAFHLGDQALLIERNERVGGWCRSIEIDGFTFDYAGHIMFSNDPYVHQMYDLLLGENVHWQDREAWIYSKSVYTRYPFQGALYGLPADVIKECLIGAIEARFGSLTKQPVANESAALNKPNQENGHTNGKSATASNGRSHSVEVHSGSVRHVGTTGCTNGFQAEEVHRSNGGPHSEGLPNRLSDCCGDGVLESTASLGKAEETSSEPARPRNFEEFIYQVWGSGIAKHFAIPYNRKLWAVPLSEMETSWLGGRVPLPDLGEMIEGALSPVPKPMGPNARFGYPLRGGFQALMDGFLAHISGRLKLDASVIGFSPLRHEITLADGSVVSYKQLISTMPLPVLIRLAGDEIPEEIRHAANRLRFISVRCVHLGIGRESITDKHWIYYPEDTIFHRIFVQGNASPSCNPPGGFGLTCEITYRPESKPLPCEGDALIQRCIEDCIKVGIIEPEDEIRTTAQVDLPHAYVVYDHARASNVNVIREWLANHDVILAGRYSEWEYYNSDHAFLAGKKAAENAMKRIADRQSRTSAKGSL